MYITDYFSPHHPLLIKKPDRPNKLLSLVTRGKNLILFPHDKNIFPEHVKMSKCQNVKMYAFHLSKLPLVWSWKFVTKEL